jgi:hypothetical protein
MALSVPMGVGILRVNCPQWIVGRDLPPGAITDAAKEVH